MIITFLFNTIIAIVGVIFGWLPDVNTLPTINGYDIDAFMMNAMGQLNSIFTTVWALKYLFGGFLAIMAYYLLKITLNFILGSRGIHN